ncbi:MAG TPA: BTAD domain-containing putative transcriptional regulator, partial [Thermoanaerobaculia bacterium]|nr:BTAD domain-containing putative transcriptional regulator [Thermoanaerobaculia bacterium]
MCASIMVATGAPGTEAASLQIEMLGGFRVQVGARWIEPDQWRLRKAAALVKLLALEPGGRLQRDQLGELLWPRHRPEAAGNNLRYALHVARRLLGPSQLSRERDSLVLAPGGLTTDVGAFEAAAAAARRSRDPAEYRRALDLYRGDLLPENPYEDWAASRREQLRALHLDLLAELAEQHEARGESELAIDTLERLIAAEPVREEAHRRLMRLHAAAGRRERALEQYRRLSEALRSEQDAEPDTTSASLYLDIVERPPLAARSTISHPPRQHGAEDPEMPPGNNLPGALTSFVGREREIGDLVALLREAGGPRLVTLTGTGGSGKTRLALEVLARVVDCYPDGMWLAELAGLAEVSLVPQSVASAVCALEAPRRPPVEVLVERLARRRALLLLDNCEHLAPACAELADTLLRRCLRLRIVATSRQALGIAGEALWPVPPLSLPPTSPAASTRPNGGMPNDPSSLLRYDAVRLFVERARLSRPGFTLTTANASAVVEICRRVDALPLAIELATARLRVLSPTQILARLDDRFQLLTGGGSTTVPRHQTLRGVVDWSYGLLTPPERTLFDRLSIFAGGFTLQAVEQVCREPSEPSLKPPDVLDILDGLVEKSLVLVEERRAEARYRLLETLREYAKERLEQSPHATAVRRRHAEYFIALAVRAEPELSGPGQVSWLDRLDDEHDNLRATLGWCLDHEPAAGLRLGHSLWQFWDRRGYFGEGRAWIERLLPRAPAATPERARALYVAGNLAVRQGERAAARQLYEECLALAGDVGERWYTARALESLGWMAHDGGDDQAARALLARSRALFDEIGDPLAKSFSLAQQARLATIDRDYARARVLFEEALTLVRQLGDIREIAAMLCALANVLRIVGEYLPAAALLEEALTLYREIGDRFGA